MIIKSHLYKLKLLVRFNIIYSNFCYLFCNNKIILNVILSSNNLEYKIIIFNRLALF